MPIVYYRPSIRVLLASRYRVRPLKRIVSGYELGIFSSLYRGLTSSELVELRILHDPFGVRLPIQPNKHDSCVYTLDSTMGGTKDEKRMHGGVEGKPWLFYTHFPYLHVTHSTAQPVSIRDKNTNTFVRLCLHPTFVKKARINKRNEVQTRLPRTASGRFLRFSGG